MLNVEIDRRGELGRVRDQGDLPICLAHATSTVHRRVQETGHPLSAETLHYHANGADWSSGCVVEDLRQALRDEGQPEDRHCEPIDGNLNSWSPPTDVQVYQSESKKKPPLPEIVEETIRASNLPILGISLPEGFYEPDPPWLISSGQIRGMPHAVAGIGLGHQEDGTAVLIRNSWGEDWADSGHAWLDASFLEKHLKAVLVLTEGDGA